MRLKEVIKPTIAYNEQILRMSTLNDVAPPGFRIPTEAEWEAERLTWTTNNIAGAFGSILKIPTARTRQNNGSFTLTNIGWYWTKDIDGIEAKFLQISDSNKFLTRKRASACSIRPIKDKSYTGIAFTGGTFNGLEYQLVTSLTGRVWLDRNLGATQVATSFDDTNAYGDLYQWGRLADGHEKRTSGITAVLSTTDEPGHGEFITSSAAPFDWRSPQNNNLWQSVRAGYPGRPCITLKDCIKAIIKNKAYVSSYKK